MSLNANSKNMYQLNYRQNYWVDEPYRLVTPVQFQGIKSNYYGNILDLKISVDADYTRYSYINTQSIVEIICEVGGFAILLWYFAKYLSSYVHPFYLQVALIKELFRTDPKVPNHKVSLCGVAEEEFRPETIYRAFERGVEEGY